MVTHGFAYRDTLDITRRIRQRVATPLSILVAPPTLDAERLLQLKEAGVDMIGIGLDAVTEELFRGLRTDVPHGGLSWQNYWQIVDAARRIYGPWKVNCHTLVGLGESDRDLMGIFARLLERQVFSYLFCFNPEPDSRMAAAPRAASPAGGASSWPSSCSRSGAWVPRPSATTMTAPWRGSRRRPDWWSAPSTRAGRS